MLKREYRMSREDWTGIFAAAGIRKGSRVLLQMKKGTADATIGGVQAVLEALMGLAGPEGLLCVPAFTPESLDPACLDGVEYSQWAQVRKNIPGFDEQLSLPEDEGAVVLRQYDHVRRSSHPLYSFVYWGMADEAWMRQPLDFPFDFETVLSFFEDRRSRNVLVDLPARDSILYHAMAHYVGLDVVSLKKAVVRKQKRNQSKVFLDSRPRAECETMVMDLLEWTEPDGLENVKVISLGLYSSPSKTREIFSKARMQEGGK